MVGAQGEQPLSGVRTIHRLVSALTTNQQKSPLRKQTGEIKTRI